MDNNLSPAAESPLRVDSPVEPRGADQQNRAKPAALCRIIENSILAIEDLRASRRLFASARYRRHAQEARREWSDPEFASLFTEIWHSRPERTLLHGLVAFRLQQSLEKCAASFPS